MVTKKPAHKFMIKITRDEAFSKNLDRYFTGEPCKYGHIAEREVGHGLCVECRADIEQTKETKKERQTLSCKQCGERFNQKRNDQVFCSPKCRLAYWSPHDRRMINCKHCNDVFTQSRTDQQYCSARCRYDHFFEARAREKTLVEAPKTDPDAELQKERILKMWGC
jgi:hypothetical protein